MNREKPNKRMSKEKKQNFLVVQLKKEKGIKEQKT